MFFGSELPDSLSQLTDSLCIIVDSLLQNLVFLHEVLRGDLILASIFHHHVEFLFAHPGFRLVCIEQVLMCFFPLRQIVLAFLDGICSKNRDKYI